MTAYLYEVLERLVAFDTVSSNSDAPAMEFLADRLAAHGFRSTSIAWRSPARRSSTWSHGPARRVPMA